jgi:hypothetical protein
MFLGTFFFLLCLFLASSIGAVFGGTITIDGASRVAISAENNTTRERGRGVGWLDGDC